MDIQHYIDHTILKPTTLLHDIETVCREAREYSFAAVCVPPPFVSKAREWLSGTSIRVATVAGFPFGYAAIEAKIAEILLSLVDGADEVDVVINLIALKNNDWTYLANELNHILPLLHQRNKVVKMIIESGILTDEEIIRCCELYGAAGVDFLKTSTGYAEKGASVAAVQLMRQHLPPQIRIKASGGIRNYAFARQLIEAGANRIGCSSSVAIMKEARAFEGDR